MLRAAVAAKTPLGIIAKETMEKGELVTVAQAEKLDEMLQKQGTKIDKVLDFAIDDSILEERITGRWIHASSGRTYHTKFAPPKVPGIDDVTGEPLMQRKDDTAAVLKSRLEAFHRQTEPVIDYYNKKGVVAKLPAEKPPKEVTIEDFLVDSLKETNDCEDLQVQAITNFKPDHVDAYDSDCDDEATTNAIFMENLSLIGSIDSDILFE
nr:adenylate kinase 4 [Tanacetum cinerariifolium]